MSAALPPKTSPRRISWAVIVAFILLVGFLVLLGISLSRAQSGPPEVGDKAP